MRVAGTFMKDVQVCSKHTRSRVSRIKYDLRVVLKSSWRYVASRSNTAELSARARSWRAYSRIERGKVTIARVRVVVTGGHCQGFVRTSLPAPWFHSGRIRPDYRWGALGRELDLYGPGSTGRLIDNDVASAILPREYRQTKFRYPIFDTRYYHSRERPEVISKISRRRSSLF